MWVSIAAFGLSLRLIDAGSKILFSACELLFELADGGVEFCLSKIKSSCRLAGHQFGKLHQIEYGGGYVQSCERCRQSKYVQR